MTFFHFLNCLVLSYVPYIIVYRTSGLNEYGAYWKCVQAGAMYFVTQFLKMLLLATFFPETDSNNSEHLDVIGELLKCSVDLADLVGLYFIMTKISIKGPLKFTSAAVGWATAEFIMTRLVPFWVGARGTEFDWVYIQLSFESNLKLVQHITTASLVWLYSRTDISELSRYVVLALLISIVYQPVIIQGLAFSVALGPWYRLLVKVLLSITTAVIAIPLFGNVSTTSY